MVVNDTACITDISFKEPIIEEKPVYKDNIRIK